jgi:hypothetical protein
MNVLVPLLEAGSPEEDGGMAARWAALLANAARGDAGPEVPPSFADVLRQLTRLAADEPHVLHDALRPTPQSAAINPGRSATVITWACMGRTFSAN